MFKEFKYTIWYTSIKIFLVYIFSIFINLFIVGSFLGLIEDSELWKWVITVLAILMNVSLVYMFASIDGRRAIQFDSTNEKRKARNENFTYENAFDMKNGFISGLISMVPFMILYVVFVIMKASGSELIILEALLKFIFIQYFKFISIWDFNVIMVITFMLIHILVSGLSYMSAKNYKKKVQTIIKRNEENNPHKGIKK